MKKLRVPLPIFRTNEMLVLSKKLSAKHLADGETSVLNNLKLSDFHAAVERASQLNDEAEALRNQSAQRILDRNTLLKQISGNVRQCRDVLTGVHILNMKNLSDWGFDVIEAPVTAVVKVKASKKPKQASSPPEESTKV